MSWSISVRNASERLRVVAADDLRSDGAVGDVDRGHQRDGAVPDILELAAFRTSSRGPAGPVFTGLGLDPGLLVHAEQHRVGGNRLVEGADLGGAGEEVRVVGPIQPAADPVDFDVGAGQDPPDLTRGDPDTLPGVQVFGDRPVGPLRVGFGWLTGRGRDDQQVHIDVVDRRAPGPGPVAQRPHTPAAVIPADFTHRGRGAAGLPGDDRVRDLVRGGEQDPGPLDLPELAADLVTYPPQGFTATPGQPYRVGAGQPGHDRPPSMIDKSVDHGQCRLLGVSARDDTRDHAHTGRRARTGKRVKDDLAADLDHHASLVWPGLEEVTVRWRGGYGYVTA